MESFLSIMRNYPALPVFLTLGLGFWLGKLRIGNFQLGSVTAVLLVGTLVGQMDITVSGPLKSFFFMMFLFSIGYKVGPDFFRSLKGSGAKQALFALVMSATIFVTTLLTAWIMGYNKGETIGLFSGSQTCSALMGVGTEALGRLDLPKEKIDAMLNIVPVCYAVTYIFGTLGTVIILGNLGPRLLGGIDKVKALTHELEEKLDKGTDTDDPALIPAHRKIIYRAYTLCDSFAEEGITIREAEKRLHKLGLEVFFDRVRHDGKIYAPRHDARIYSGDSVVICGKGTFMVCLEEIVGPEIIDTELQSYPITRMPVVVAKKDFIGINLLAIRKKKYMHGVVIRDGSRDGKDIDISYRTTFKKGDRLTLLGHEKDVLRAGKHIGHMDRPTVSSDLMFVGLVLFIGGLFGALNVWIGDVPVSFGTSGGALLAGLVFGWLRSKRPTYGHISPRALWVMNNLGLNVFIAIIGIEAAPSFVSGIRTVGPLLFIAGAVATTIPLFIGLWLGHKVFKFNPAITLGCCSGTRTCTASLGAVQASLGSSLPAIGYTVTYAVSNIMLVIWGLLTVMIIS